VNDRPDDLHAQVLKVDVLPFERQNLFGPEASALRHDHHRAIGLWNQGEDLVILLDGQDNWLLPPFADPFGLDQLRRFSIESPAPVRQNHANIPTGSKYLLADYLFPA
jgi:hypothetical protein